MTTAFEKKVQDVLRQAKEHAALDKTVWIPEKEGETVAGQIVENSSMVVKILGEVPTSLLKCDDNEYRRFSWGGATVRAAWDRFRPEVGDYVVAAYHGKRAPKTENFGEYDDIEVVVLGENLEKKVSIIDTVDAALKMPVPPEKNYEPFEGADD